MQFPTLHFYSSRTFEQWDYRNPDVQGIGGSETCQIELAKRFAKRGYKVISYGPIPEDTISPHDGVEWKHYNEANFSEDGVWIFSRCPHMLEKFVPTPTRRAWLICQDWEYDTIANEFTFWNEEYRDKLERIITLCPESQESYLKQFPNLVDKICLGGNGIKVEIMREIDKENIKRNPNKIFYFSSPDRGLLDLVHIFNKTREYIPELELHIGYGFNNLDKMDEKSYFGLLAQKIKAAIKDKDNIFFKGRLPQGELYREIASSQFWVYPTNFLETGCIASMEAMAMGAIPISSIVGALKHNIQFGERIAGDIDNPMTKMRFIRALREWTEQESLIDSIRPRMMEWSRQVFSWERICDKYEAWIHNVDIKRHSPYCQFIYQLINAKGAILNVGSNDDGANLGALGATNIDIQDVDPATGNKNRAHILADARNLPLFFTGLYDTVILGEILEHFLKEEDVIRVLLEAKRCLNPTGKIAITVPEDYRGIAEQRGEHWSFPEEVKFYTEDSVGYHHTPITKDILMGWLRKANLKPELYREMDYGFCKAHGVVAC